MSNRCSWGQQPDLLDTLHADPFSSSMLDDSQASARRQVIHSNFALIGSAAAELGGVPAMLSAQDCCAPGGLHEHAVVGCELASILSTHACTRLEQLTALLNASLTAH